MSKKSSKISKDEENALNWRPTSEEKELIRTTWSDDFEFLYKLGTKIYSTIFERDPSLFSHLFPHIHRYGEKWADSAEFRSQALKFVQTISYTVNNIEHIDEFLVTYLRTIGAAHAKFASRGFKTEHWDLFLDAMESTISEQVLEKFGDDKAKRKDAVAVWRILAEYITAQMKRGFFDRLENVAQGKQNKDEKEFNEELHRIRMGGPNYRFHKSKDEERENVN